MERYFAASSGIQRVDFRTIQGFHCDNPLNREGPWFVPSNACRQYLNRVSPDFLFAKAFKVVIVGADIHIDDRRVSLVAFHLVGDSSMSCHYTYRLDYR